MCDTRNDSVHQGRGRRHAVKRGKKDKKVRKQTIEDRLTRIEEDLSAVVGSLHEVFDRLEPPSAQAVNGGGANPGDAFPIVRIEASNVTGSPYLYLYVYLTPALSEGPHLIVSDAAEYGETGIIVGRYDHYEHEGYQVATYETWQLAIEHMQRLMEDVSAPTPA
jgi:hypothetical protein